MECRGPTSNPRTPPLPSTYFKSSRYFLQQKDATTTTVGNILFLDLIFEAAAISSCWKNRERYMKREKRMNGAHLTDTHSIFVLVQYFCCIFPQKTKQEEHF